MQDYCNLYAPFVHLRDSLLRLSNAIPPTPHHSTHWMDFPFHFYNSSYNHMKDRILMIIFPNRVYMGGIIEMFTKTADQVPLFTKKLD